MPTEPAPVLLSRLTIALYLLSLALLPWGAVLPLSWLHPHAQWGDVALAAAVASWATDHLRRRQWPRWRPVHFALAAYLLAATLSCFFSSLGSASKLLGIASLVGLTVVTADLAARRGALTRLGRVVTATALLSAAAAALGFGLFLIGIPTPLVGTYGDLLAGDYVRVQAGLHHPNLLASFCIFAAGVAMGAGVGRRLRTVTLAALSVTVLLTFSRGMLGFALAALVGRATTPRRRAMAAAFAFFGVVALAALTVGNLSLDPTRPLEVGLVDRPSSRFQSVTSSWRTLLTHPVLGSGPGTSPGMKGGVPFDAHFTPLNVAATLGLPALVALLAVPALLWRDRRQPTNLGLWGALAGIGLDSLAQDVEDFRHLWVLFGLIDGESAGPSSHGAREAGEPLGLGAQAGALRVEA